MILMKLKKLICLSTTLILFASLCFGAYASDEVCALVEVNGEETSYTSFADAWNKAAELGKSGEVTFTLKQNWKADDSGSLGGGAGFKDGALYYSGAKNLTLDLNGYYIDRNIFKPVSGGAVIYVGSVMTITDSRRDEYTSSELFKGGAIQNGANTERGGGIVVYDNARLEFNGGTVLNCVSTDDGGAVSAFGSGAVLNVNGGSFYGNRTYDASGECCGGAIYSNSGTVNVKNAVFECNYAEDNGGAIYMYGGNLTVSSSSFYSNSSIEEGGAVCLDGDVKTSISDCLFYANASTTDDAGAVYCDSDDGTYLNDCRMFYNSSASEGGAVYINRDKVFVLGGTYRYNTASSQGGGIYVDSLNDINASGKLIIKDNTVNGRANDLCLQDGAASTAYLYCGGFYEGSSIWLCSNDKNAQLAIKGIDKFQYNNYIHFDDGFSESKVISSALGSDDIRAMASVFGNGNIVYICICIAVIIAFAVFVVKYGKKKKGAENND